MNVKTEAIVLQIYKYGESSLIVHFFTEKFGRINCIVHNVYKPRSKNKISFFQLGSILQIEIDYKQSRTMQLIKDIAVSDPLFEIRGHILKSIQITFICEILFKTMREEGEFPFIFDFVKSTFQYLNVQSNMNSNFHIIFLIHLTKYLGIIPQHNFSSLNKYFDVSKSCFVEYENQRTIKATLSHLLHLFLDHEIDYDSIIQIDRIDRNELVDILLLYYSYHISDFGELKSVGVLRDVLK